MTTDNTSTANPNPPRIAIVGAGVSGICMGALLQRNGFHDFVIYERSDNVGGVWYSNSYPGLWCDVPARLYSYTFAPNPQWRHLFADRNEIHGYLRQVTTDNKLDNHIRTRAEVTQAAFREGRWHLSTSRGIEQFDILVCATGILVNPAIPALTGIETFAGQAFHASQWDHSTATTGKRVAVIGNGSTGVQITSTLAPSVNRLLMFQRTAQWILPLPNKHTSIATRLLHSHLPGYAALTNLLWRTAFEATIGRAVVQPGWQRRLIAWTCRRYLDTVRDPQLRAKLTPDYQAMCKRLVRSTNFYQAVQRPNVDVITEMIDHVTPTGIKTSDGKLHEVDVIVYATGFRGGDFMRPMKLTGANGIDLDHAWRAGPRSYNSVAIPGFPNLFMMSGPNSPYSHDSVMRTAETHAGYILQWVDRMHRRQVSTVCPTEAAMTRFQRDLQAALPNTAFTTGCSNWYQNSAGQPMIWPWTAARHRQLLAAIDLHDFHTEPATTQTRTTDMSHRRPIT